jgi:hypothetical protein
LPLRILRTHPNRTISAINFEAPSKCEVLPAAWPSRRQPRATPPPAWLQPTTAPRARKSVERK